MPQRAEAPISSVVSIAIMLEWYKITSSTCTSSESPGGDSGLSLSAYLAFGRDTSHHSTQASKPQCNQLIRL
ncbi:hypothetical protein JVT61DRAFT_11248 [Boletus reticuloceps]|uniref:Uncharacterized protein n=1 Tax=Boletus reticuloceps TaxID=495285 RepID=A0A8I3A518_9AGAM|nr:hypothetical protein JVT61DRAFT_11248 [Boletus reticuloceps]